MPSLGTQHGGEVSVLLSPAVLPRPLPQLGVGPLPEGAFVPARPLSSLPGHCPPCWPSGVGIPHRVQASLSQSVCSTAAEIPMGLRGKGLGWAQGRWPCEHLLGRRALSGELSSVTVLSTASHSCECANLLHALLSSIAASPRGTFSPRPLSLTKATKYRRPWGRQVPPRPLRDAGEAVARAASWGCR